VKRILLAALCVALLGAGQATASPAYRLAIVHVMRGCHVFATAAKELGPTPTLTVERGARVELRIACPMDFDVVKPGGQVTRLYSGTTTTFTFPKRGLYVFRATNVQSAESLQLQTLGPDNVLVLRVRVR
jgi:hypothetical protein